MKRRQRKTRGHSGHSNVQAGALGVAISLAVILAICAMGALAISREWLPESAAAVFAPLAVGLAMFVSPLPLIRQMGKRPLPIAYGHMVGILLVLLLFRTIFWPGYEFGSWGVPMCAVVGATAAGILGGKRKAKHR